MLEFDPYQNPFRDQIISKPFTIDEQGYVAVPAGPGLGVEVREDLVKKYARK